MRPHRNPARKQALREAFSELARSGLVELSADGAIATRRWRAALSRAALAMIQQHGDTDDPRFPIALALYRIYGDRESDGKLADKVEVMLSLQERENDWLRVLARGGVDDGRLGE